MNFSFSNTHFAHEYDNFFDPSLIEEEENSYFHYYISSDENARKVKMNFFNPENEQYVKKSFLLLEKKEEILQSIEENNTAPKRYEPLLEVSLDKLMKDLMESIIEEHQNDSIPQKEKLSNLPSISGNKLLWTDKYMPKHFSDLLSDDKINREVLTWLKSWDLVVFKKKIVRFLF